MSKWERRFFYVPLADGSRQLVSGPAYRGLAMVHLETRLWSLTHVKSGHRIFRIKGQRADAYKLAEGIAGLVDWSAYDPEEIRKIPGIVERIKAVAAMHVGASDAEAGNA